MARFKITATITIEGADINTPQDAIEGINVMLQDYDDMNAFGADISILLDEPKLESNTIACPYCGSEHTHKILNDDCYHCKECGDDFYFEDTIREPIRHAISAIIFQHATNFDTKHTQENPVEFDHPLGLPSVIGIFETEDGIIFFNPNDGGKPIEFDDMDTDTLTAILEILEQQDLNNEKL